MKTLKWTTYPIYDNMPLDHKSSVCLVNCIILIMVEMFNSKNLEKKKKITEVKSDN